MLNLLTTELKYPVGSVSLTTATNLYLKHINKAYSIMIIEFIV